MQRRSIVHESASFERDKNANTSAVNPNTRRKLQRRKKQSTSWCSGVTGTEILALTALSLFILVCGIMVGNRVYDALEQKSSDRMARYRRNAANLLHPDSLLHPSPGNRPFTPDHNDENNKMPLNKIYSAPDTHHSVGDRSDRYAELRKSIDIQLPVDVERSLSFVHELQTEQFEYTAQPMDVHNSDQLDTYDIMDCPETPPEGYPYAWNMMELLTAWPPDDPTPRPSIYQGLCVFDYTKDYDKAMTYRKAEVPFVTANDPAVAATTERWNTPGYMESLLGNEEHRCEFSENNHFMYFTPVSKKPRRNKARGKKVPDGWTAPTQKLWLRYRDWLNHANVTDDKLGPDKPHWYFRLIGCGLGMGNDGHCDRSASEYLFDELPFFQPKADLLYMVDYEAQMGIHCRFGMKGVIAENHFDGSRNSIAVFGGTRRYILSHPDECNKLALFPKGHPSARHSAVDWSHPDVEEYPEFAQAKGNEIVLHPGQVLYLPTQWFHFIVSLELNMQCNTRSGINPEYHNAIHECGF